MVQLVGLVSATTRDLLSHYVEKIKNPTSHKARARGADLSKNAK